MKVDPFHLISTPIPVLPTLGLRSAVGLSAEDPSGKRHKGMAFSAWLTVYSPEGARVRRTRIGELAAGDRRVYDISALTDDLGYDKPYLTVVHRVPHELNVETETAEAELADGGELDFDMYRSVVQLERPNGGRGSVIYETPPFFNANPAKPGSFLCFSNQLFVGPESETYVVLLHYSIAAKYGNSARRRVLAYAPDGSLAGDDAGEVGPFRVDVVDAKKLVGGAASARQFSFVACSDRAAMIPLIVNVNARLGGVSVEHTHPPISYLNMPMPLANQVRADAIAHHLALPAKVPA